MDGITQQRCDTSPEGWLRKGDGPAWKENRLGVDYREVARALGPPVVPMIDTHAHIMGSRAAEVYGEVAQWFGIERVYSQSRLGGAAEVKAVLGDRVRFVAFPDWGQGDPQAVHRGAYLDVIRRWHGEFDAKCVKFWSGPGLWDMASGDGSDASDVVPFDAPWRVKQAELACELGMMLMVHIADPDTWFASKWADASRYGTKEDQYRGLEVMVERFNDRPWIAAHMGGWPENLPFLDGLLSRHPNLYLDTSATKWMLRELSGHEPSVVRGFFEKWCGRLLFGSDIVTTDEHLKAEDTEHPRGLQATSKAEAQQLYASRYACLRTLFETRFEGESPIVDPDLAMLEPDRFDAMSAPMLRGMGLGRETLQTLYRGAHESVVEAWANGTWKVGGPRTQE